MYGEIPQVLNLSYDPGLKCVFMEWTGFSGTEVFRESNERVLQLLRQEGSDKIIADLRKMRIISIEDQQWLYQDWIPRAINSGLRWVGIVESDDFFNRLPVDNVSQQMNGKLNIRYFNSFLGARSWVRGLEGNKENS